MSRGHAVRRAALRTAIVALTLGAGPIGAQTPVTLTFNGLGALDPSAGINYVDNCYVEQGFMVQVAGFACGEPYALATYTPDDPTGYTGSPALFDNLGFGVAITAGNPFAVTSIDLAPILLGAFAPTPTTVTLLGALFGGGSVSTDLIVPAGAAGLTTFALTGFSGMTSFTITPSAPDYSVQFDNVAILATPEPTTVVLVGGGLLGLAAAIRRRRA